MFQFKQYPNLSDDRILLELKEMNPADPARGLVPEYKFRIFRTLDGIQVGGINLRIGDCEELRLYNGHIGFGIDAPYRGNHYAARACHLIKPVALDHGLSVLWITSKPENGASRRICELIGADFVETVDLPKSHELYHRGIMQLCRYRWKLCAAC